MVLALPSREKLGHLQREDVGVALDVDQVDLDVVGQGDLLQQNLARLDHDGRFPAKM